MQILQLMSKELSLDPDYILKLSIDNMAYKKYRIPKKNGKGKREIYHPSKSLKLLQYWLVRRIFNKFPISKYSKAYSKGNSIKKNALIHRDSNYILHMDITKFFESITPYHVDKLLDKIEDISKDDKELIKRIILYNGEYLVVGSVASPVVSNCIMYNIDLDIFEKCIKGTKLNYTRYADDIVISSKSFIDKEIIDKISDILKYNKFDINRSKTYFMNKSKKRTVTGIVIDNNSNRLSLGSKKYKEIKSMIYNLLIKGNGDKGKILGYLSYIRDIDEDKYNSIRSIYIKYDKNNTLFY
ncbi:MAG: retron St85 family RNA-directed DNA polymerase [Clostridium sp.]|uniref:retron St85 family RNA-directed DNA polymerase n=1 Tax=Clostridium sp. TaxID=1506 RepID=UPI0028FFE263|nr:retron St85 family RNA-directed DNA polymerase [Clostridium sp.]MDU2895706.1 retron St85 family RNA-directed DNA polymerase [Clostridium sp.]MDU3008098.1 retron St85 family RNA-directed DNA polymerase [Clostridium sp.]MDU3037953.1 retron St85 family RNA-directed DNA polymerase [Clostridium sp.]MDU3052931.1 retron St85 family RNA-directed DNA polymerase [Clostridium sp.]